MALALGGPPVPFAGRKYPGSHEGEDLDCNCRPGEDAWWTQGAYFTCCPAHTPPACVPNQSCLAVRRVISVFVRNASRNKRSRRDPLTKEVDTLVQLVLQTYKLKKLVIKEDMLKIVNKKYKSRFHEILRRASFSTEVVFGIDLKEIDSVKPSYALVSKMDLPNNGRLSRGRGLPKTGLLMILLGMIFMKGNCASEEKTWEFLNKMRIFAGKRHFIFGEPRKLITQDFVKLKYLAYRQVPNSDPPSYEFLWGPRAHAETSKMKVLEFLAKINDTVPSALPSLYEEALRDEEERARATVPDRADPTAMASVVRAPVPGAAARPRPSEA
ncbi:melanoma-associated antigen B3-like [Elephas maximus indicus]|uniref:melanoma-associated antigen B3-like n=1 Tax=Elephas maximus indicus TaxID=99487 RepID=UPI002116D38E|nr:melanoma-associated antigen B3-like [Elephas maximus indicus]